jgi:hypothetical protein
VSTAPRSALRSVGVWVGFAGLVAVAWGSCHPEFSFDPEGWPAAWVNAIGGVLVLYLNRVLIVAGVVALTWGWWHIRPTKDRPAVHAPTTLALWSLPLLVVPPVLSPDAALYADLGWTLSTGANPYLVGLATTGGPFATQVDPLWAGSGVAYPPLTLLLAQAMVTLAGFHPYWSIVAMRIPALLSVAAMLWLVPRIAPMVGVRKRGAVWLGVLNPLLVLHFIGAAHNDAPMVALSLAAIWACLRWPNWWATFGLAPLLVGVAMALKQQGGLTVIAVAGLPVIAELGSRGLGRRLWLLGWRTLVVTIVAVAAFVAISLASGLGFGWTGWLDLMGLAATPAPLALLAKLGALMAQAAGGSYTGFLILAGRVSTALLLIALVWIVIRFSDRPLHIVAWGSLAIAVLGQALHPWYLPWSLALLALIAMTRRQRYAVFGLAIAFGIWNGFQTVIWHGQY